MRKLTRYGTRVVPLGLIAAMSVVVVGGNGAANAQQDQQVLRGDKPPAAEVVKDQYIVTLRKQAVRTDSVGSTAATLARTYGGQVMRTYSKAVFGYAATMSETAAKRLASDPNVEAVSPVHRFKTSDVQPDPPSWGLDRIDQAYYPLDHSYTYPNTASDVTAYVIDTGIRYSHQDFGGRATFGFDLFGGDGSDCFGHGTEVSGVLGGATHGVAKGVQLVSVRVFDCTGMGTSAGVIAGIDWIIAHPAAGPKVANMSFGGSADGALDSAVASLIASGVTVVVAAGNQNWFTCDFTPARVGPAITVGATDISDRRAQFSNWGACNDLFAPGVDIVTDASSSDTATAVDSGTSFSAPHVAGAAAMLLSDDPTLTPAQVHSKLVANTNKSHRILNIAGSNPPTTPVPAGAWHTGNPPAVSAGSRVTMTSNGSRTDAFVVSAAPGRPILHTTLVGTTWTPWENLGGNGLGNPTALWVSSTHLHVWVTGMDGAAWHRVWDGSSWSGWESLGGTVASSADLVVVSPEPGALDLYAISSGDAAVWWRNFDGHEWFEWASFGGPSSKHNFSVVVDPLTGADVIFAQGADGAAYYKYFDARNIPGAWTPLGGVLRWDIKGVATSDGQIEIFVPGMDRAVWHQRWDRTSWSGWTSLGGVVSGDGVEAVATDAGIVDVFARSVDSRVYQRRLTNGTWSPWVAVTTDTSSGIPTASGVLTYEVELAFPRVAGGIYAAHWN